ncbi:Uncharacterised protein [Vibrio cholerae]|nr:Uncharacterised protein [Vibrio cholerae]
MGNSVELVMEFYRPAFFYLTIRKGKNPFSDLSNS